jgi:hypothetical protein
LRKRFELLGESIREIGVLLLVFAPLDAVFYQGAIDFPARIGLAILAFAGLILIVVGTLAEGER